ncbi:MAG: serine/threonine-protein kinase, partial [Myxococcota bacterium]
MNRSALDTLVLGPSTREAGGHELPLAAPDRYEDLGLIAVGGMGEVRRVRDRLLGRQLVQKILRSDLADADRLIARFVREARLTATLQHPSVVAVHDLGRLADGRVFFTMREVAGDTLTRRIRELHRASRGGQWGTLPDGFTFRRLVEVIHQVCRTVAFAHDRGIVHGDLKPDNVMIGAYGEVHVLDWGLATIPDLEPGATGVAGTPAYMAPEQAFAVPRSAATDVYALGATLYDVLADHPPYVDPNPHDVLRRLRQGDRPEPLPRVADGAQFAESRRFQARDSSDDGPPIPGPLAAAARKALSRDPADRQPSAAAIADDVAAWLDGLRRADDARRTVAVTVAQVDGIEELRSRAADLRARAARRLAAIPRSASDLDKRLAWSLEDEAEALERESDQREVDVEGALRGVLAVAPGLPEAHAALADRLEALHAAAEAAGDTRTALRLESRLRAHVLALPRA